jgi:hypothetical protein
MIYHLASTAPSGYDKAWNMVVIADSEKEARFYAAAHCGDEGDDEWLYRATCTIIGHQLSEITEHGVICRDYCAG